MLIALLAHHCLQTDVKCVEAMPRRT
jgi:hypothetical protein